MYQRVKGELDTLPFGTQKDVYAPGYEWINHSLAPKKPDHSTERILVGGAMCSQPYSASVFNVSGMSYGSLSKNAVLALNIGAKMGNFAQSTGEGGLTPYHLDPGGDVIWQIGTGYFSCRNHDGTFNIGKFTERATLPQVRWLDRVQTRQRVPACPQNRRRSRARAARPWASGRRSSGPSPPCG